MSAARKAMIGRSREIAELAAALDAAAHGSGSSWWLSGEAGIGKSRLLEQLGALAAERGARLAWGRCWEAGGAPAFWPWIQVLRALFAETGAGAVPLAPARRAVLAELLPELRDDGWRAPDESSLAGEEARFKILDAVGGVLAEAARRAAPLVLAFDDFHAADPSSVLLLDFVGRAIRELPLMVVVSCREPDGSRSPVAPLLGALARRSHPLPLGPLADSEVAELVAATSPSALADSVSATIQHATEGNPLFVIEMTRLCAVRAASLRVSGAHDATGAGALAIPATLGSTLRERLEAVPGATREVLESGSLVGREFALADAAELTGVAVNDAAVHARAAVDAALVAEVAPGRFRFAHILIREVCYQALAPARRAEAHGRHAQGLERALIAGSAHTSWAECAHHWLAAGHAGRERAIAALRRAALAPRRAARLRGRDPGPRAGASRMGRGLRRRGAARARRAAPRARAHPQPRR
ncbi:MAG: AAA family ATPase [Deltaproteobacteria bacterium]|nr:AAA family ATPase [Deltaproteobacteria bacterium]